ncbi:hypothetical protein DL96DRAFT_1824783 [Flagelloscypha sp. PMI_526]|nr:hypothetical protein DL96DRAFT_1824783 [Flagelloscypha sp. PMI_526]
MAHILEDTSIVMRSKHQRHVYIDERKTYRPCSFLDDTPCRIWTYEEEILYIQAKRKSPSAIGPFPHCFDLAPLRFLCLNCRHISLLLELRRLQPLSRVSYSSFSTPPHPSLRIRIQSHQRLV